MTKKEKTNNSYNQTRENSHYCLNKNLTKKLGWTTAGILSILIDTGNYAEIHNKLIDNEWFSKTRESILKDIPIGKTQLQSIIKRLNDLNYIKTKRIGSLGKVYYRLNQNKINKEIKEETKKEINKEYKEDIKKEINKEYKEDIKKEIKEEIKKEIKKEKKNDLIEYWNSLNNTPKHKLPNTKVYKDIVTYFKYFKNGTVLKKIRLNKEYLKKNNIPITKLMKKWSDKEIKENLLKLSKIFTKGYWPVNKNKIPKNLSNLIYNTRTNRSMFLLVCFNDLKIETYETKLDIESLFKNNFKLSKSDKNSNKYTINDKNNIIKKYSYNFFKYAKLFDNLFPKLTSYDKKDLYIRIINIINMFEKIKIKNTTMHMILGSPSVAEASFGHTIVGDPTLFIIKYIDWIQNIRYIDFPISIKMIGPDSNNWKEFYKFIFETYGYDLR